ncbi:glycosyltransferase family 4 protein, partial [bacterium]|nr:glycosyltransferase family 4 protein [bacterium]
MKVLILSRDSKSTGGVVNYTNLLIRNLSERVHFERLIIGRRINRRNPLFELLAPFVDCATLLKKINRSDYSLVHLNPSLTIKSILRDGLFLIALRVAQWKNVVVFWHGWKEALEQRIKKRHFFRWLFNNVFGQVSVTLVLAPCFRESFINMGFEPSRVRVATTMFDGDIFQSPAKMNGSDCNKVLFLSRLIKEKGVYELLKAFELVTPRFPKVHLVIAGDGTERPEMEKWVAEHDLSDKVSFTGYIRGKEKGQLLLNSGLFVFPTYYGEGCPIVLLEAMGAGLAVVTTSVAAISEIVKNDVNGIILNEATPEKIAEAMCRFLGDKDFLKRVQQSNRR